MSTQASEPVTDWKTAERRPKHIARQQSNSTSSDIFCSFISFCHKNVYNLTLINEKPTAKVNTRHCIIKQKVLNNLARVSYKNLSMSGFNRTLKLIYHDGEAVLGSISIIKLVSRGRMHITL